MADSLQPIVCCLGQPVAGNPTQYMMEQAFIAAGLDWRYLTLEVPPDKLADAIRGTKEQIAFYASTPAYRGVLELHDRGELQPELTRMSKEGKWAEMANVIDDELLGLIAIVGDPQSVGKGLVERWAGTYDRLSLYTTYKIDAPVIAETIAAIRTADAASSS